MTDDKLALNEAAAITSAMTDQLTRQVEDILANTPEESAEITPQQMAQAVITMANAIEDIAQKQHQILEQLRVQGSVNAYRTSP